MMATDDFPSPGAVPKLPEGQALVSQQVGKALEHRERLPLWERMARALRVFRTAVQVRRDARRDESRMRTAGLSTERVQTARPADGMEIGLGRRRVSLVHQALVVGFRGSRAQSIVEEAKNLALGPLGAVAAVDGARVLASGVVMVELSAGGTQYLLRVAGPVAGAAAREAGAVLEELVAADPPPTVRDRLVVPIARGAIDDFSWWLEPMRPGRHPGRVGTGLWKPCLEFLVDLGSVRVTGDREVAPMLAEQSSTVRRYLDDRDRRRLDTLEQRLTGELSDLRLGWGHGDFHPGNILVDGPRLGTVLDWDAGGPAELPLLDLLHLLATSRPRLRRLSHGDRCVRRLWPLVRAGGDARIASYCERTATPRDADRLVALSQAYWLVRVAGDMRRFGDRVATSEWVERNVRRPLTELA